MSRAEQLIATEAHLFGLLYEIPLTIDEDVIAKLKARVAEVMKAQGITVVIHAHTAYRLFNGTLLESPCLQSFAVRNVVPTAEKSDADIEDAAFHAAFVDAFSNEDDEIAGDDFTSRLPIRHVRPRSEVLTSILAMSRRSRADEDTKDYIPV